MVGILKKVLFVRVLVKPFLNHVLLVRVLLSIPENIRLSTLFFVGTKFVRTPSLRFSQM